jgi:hypothetical protein
MQFVRYVEKFGTARQTANDILRCISFSAEQLTRSIETHTIRICMSVFSTVQIPRNIPLIRTLPGLVIITPGPFDIICPSVRAL